MTDKQSDENNTATTPELPEAFTAPALDQPGKQVYDNDPTGGQQEETSTGLDRVDQGSKESFPGSDVPSTTPPTKLADHPAPT